MPTITVRAPDSVTALEMVQRRLGVDALILATRTVDGLLEIRATDDPDVLVAPDQESETKSRGQIDFVIKEPIEEQPDNAQTSAAMDSSLLDAVSEGSILKPEAEPKQNNAGSSFGRILMQQRITRASRITIYGPVGSGKSLAAVQLALLHLNNEPTDSVEFSFLGSGSCADGAMLAQKSHLLGMKTTFCSLQDVPHPKTGVCQILVVSGRSPDAPQTVQLALKEENGFGLLVLPTGLHSDHVQRAAKRWGTAGAGVILSKPDYVEPSQQEIETIGEHGLSTLWVSAPDILFDGLQQPFAVSRSAEDRQEKTAEKPKSHPIFSHPNPFTELPA